MTSSAGNASSVIEVLNIVCDDNYPLPPGESCGHYNNVTFLPVRRSIPFVALAFRPIRGRLLRSMEADRRDVLRAQSGKNSTRSTGQCPLGTSAGIGAKQITDCVPVVQGKAVDSFTPIVPGSDLAVNMNPVPMPAWALRADPDLPAFSYVLNGTLEYVTITFDWRNLSQALNYSQDFTVSLYLGALWPVQRLPLGLTDPTVDKHGIIKLSFMALTT